MKRIQKHWANTVNNNEQLLILSYGTMESMTFSAAGQKLNEAAVQLKTL